MQTPIPLCSACHAPAKAILRCRAPRKCPGDTVTLHLRESEILASCRHGCVDLLSELFVAIILGKVKFYAQGQPCASKAQGQRQKDLRLKQVCELGKRSLLP